MASDRPVTTTRIACAELEALLRAIFLRHGCSEVVAAALAENMAGAERDGALSHGIFRVAGNLGSLDSGWVDGKAVPVIEDVAPGMLRGDGCQPACNIGSDSDLMNLASGVVLFSKENQHHGEELDNPTLCSATAGLNTVSRWCFSAVRVPPSSAAIIRE